MKAIKDLGDGTLFNRDTVLTLLSQAYEEGFTKGFDDGRRTEQEAHDRTYWIKRREACTKR